MARSFTDQGTAQAPDSPARNSASGVHPNYQVILEVTGDPELKPGLFPIVGNLPERINLEFSSSWDTPFAKSDFGNAAEALTKGKVNANIANDMLGAAGIATRAKHQSAHVWQSSSPLVFNIDFVLNARTNSMKDIKEKHLALLKLAAPGEALGGLILTQPGPSLLSSAAQSMGFNGRQITLKIGKYLEMRNVLITSVSSDVTCMFTDDGIPTTVTINVGVQSFFANFSTLDLDNLFMMNGQS